MTPTKTVVQRTTDGVLNAPGKVGKSRFIRFLVGRLNKTSCLFNVQLKTSGVNGFLLVLVIVVPAAAYLPE